MDKIVLKTHESTQLLKPIPIDNLHFNLSGIETQWVRTLESGAEKDFLLKELFDKFVLCLTNLTERACRQTKIEKVLFAGGVSSSEYIKNKLENHFDKSGIQLTFGTPGLSGDNAVGTALLGGEVLWQ